MDLFLRAEVRLIADADAGRVSVYARPRGEEEWALASEVRLEQPLATLVPVVHLRYGKLKVGLYRDAPRPPKQSAAFFLSILR